MKVKKMEEKISIYNEKRHTMYKKKWQQIENVFNTKTFCGVGGVGVGLKRGSREKKIVFSNQRDR